MNFYKNVIEHKGKLLVRGVRDSKEFKEKINFSPTLYSGKCGMTLALLSCKSAVMFSITFPMVWLST